MSECVDRQERGVNVGVNWGTAWWGPSLRAKVAISACLRIAILAETIPLPRGAPPADKVYPPALVLQVSRVSSHVVRL